MNFVKNNLANALTLGNLFCGSIAAINTLNNNYLIAAVCLTLSLVLDFFDGFVARALKSNSNLGAQLDSLADMVSFGLVPGLLLFNAFAHNGNELFGITLPFEIKYFGLFVTLFSCLRLAIFNLDEEQTYYFKGLNTPSNTILIFGALYFLGESHASNQFASAFTFNFSNEILLFFTIISSWLLISPIKMIAMKFKSKKLEDNYPKVFLVIGALLIMAIFQLTGIPLVIIYYILISLIFQKQLK